MPTLNIHFNFSRAIGDLGKLILQGGLKYFILRLYTLKFLRILFLRLLLDICVAWFRASLIGRQLPTILLWTAQISHYWGMIAIDVIQSKT